MRFLCPFLILPLFLTLHAQRYKRHYEIGKTYLAQQNYHEARRIFKDLTTKKAKNLAALQPYTLFYWAISAYHSREKHESLYATEKILSQYPNWAEIDEVHYFIGVLNLERLRGLKAVRHFKYIQDSSFRVDIENALNTYLDSMPYEIIADLYEIYPTDTLIGQAFYHKLKARSKSATELDLFEKLEKLYMPPIPSQTHSSFKDKYRVALLLPKRKSDPSDYINPIVLEFVLAAKLAAQELKSQNINLEFFIFDILDDSAALSTFETTIREQPPDLFLSLVHKDYFQPIYDLILELERPFLTLTAEKKLIDQNPFVCSLLPNLETIIAAGTAFMIDSLNASKAYIIKDATVESDSISSLYQNMIRKSGGEVEGIITFNNERGNFQKNLRTFTANLKLDEDTLNLRHAFVITKSENILRNALALLKTASFKRPILGQQHWLESRQVPLNQMEEANIYFLTNYMMTENESYWNFVAQYARANKKMPNIYAKLGYIATHFLGEMLEKYGLEFYKELDLEPKIKIKFFSDIDFKTNNENQNTHICTFENGHLVKVK